MPSQYFIGITPPPDYQKKFKYFQHKWLEFLIVEPHITLKAQGGLTPDKEWIVKVKTVCKRTQPFPITLAKPNYFGDNILYLSVLSDELYPLHEAIVRAISPPPKLINQYFELDNFVAHLTLGKEQHGLTKEALSDMAHAAEKELTPYPTFLVKSVQVYELSPDSKRYEPLLQIPLG
ncbi:2'-5' RNA ligase family protein [Bacillus sp. es.036]|uniref:2'-5' RNA ligase family protein n=1 Tax=Bacillus sp. es.036 TaxID=1761764 RepID=UPI000BFA7971|nr:2'-5' RNA ligase family protein [Bacillus sp. es.036]PFG12240.1 2'-5' RNA ligase [Bacillus sp. es.036]